MAQSLGAWQDQGQVARTPARSHCGKALAPTPPRIHVNAMRKTISSLLACGLLILAGCADAKNPSNSADPALWVVKDADTTIYLFGTVHVLKPEIVWFDDEVKAAFDRSNELVLEMVEPPPAQMAGHIAKIAWNPKGPRTSELLPEKDRADYLAAMKTEKLPLDTLDYFDPWVAAINLSVAPLQRMGYQSEAGAEEVLARAAKASGKPVSGLETAEEQLSYFDGLPQNLQLSYLNATVDELPEMPEQFTRMIQDWSRGNIKAIAREMNSSLDKTPELAQVLLYQRNARWADWIARRMDQPGTVFIAVGAGHLAGKGSVQDELAKRRLKVTRLGKKDFGLN